MNGQYAKQNDFIRRTYDRIPLVIPKGTKERIKKLASDRGLSVNKLVWGGTDKG